jgi:hypothetical protein
MSDNLTRNQVKAIKALLEFPTIEKAAAAIGVNPRTITRWLDDRSFRAELARAEGDALDKTTRKLLYLGDHAVNALASVLQEPNQRGASNKRLAAQTILTQLLKLRELRNIEERIADLEAAVYGKAN